MDLDMDGAGPGGDRMDIDMDDVQLSQYVLTPEEARATEGDRKLPRMRLAFGRDALDGSGEGGVPGFLLPGGLARIVSHLRDACGMRGADAVFCDIGCGQGRPLLAVMEAAPCLGGVVGFDIDRNVLRVADVALNKFQSLAWTGKRYEQRGENGERGGDPSPPAHLVHADFERLTNLGDLERLTNLGRATHAYCFCFGMPPTVLKHLFRVCAHSPSLRFLVLVYKRAAGDHAWDVVGQLNDAGVDCHHFERADGKSELQMPGGTMPRGCCVTMSERGREVLLAAAAGEVACDGGACADLELPSVAGGAGSDGAPLFNSYETSGIHLIENAISVEASTVAAIRQSNFNEHGIAGDRTRQQTKSCQNQWCKRLIEQQVAVLREHGHLRTSAKYGEKEKEVHMMRGLLSLETEGYDETAVEPQEGDQEEHTDQSVEVLQGMADVDKPSSTMYAIQDGTRLRIKPLDGDWVTLWLKPGDLLVFRGDVCHHGMGYAGKNYRVHAYLYPPGYKPGPSSLHPCP